MKQALAALLLFGSFNALHADDDFGVTEVIIDQADNKTVFTFRNSQLVHEVTFFSGIKTQTWTERFFCDGQEIFMRAGTPDHFSSHYKGKHSVHITNGGKRLSAGNESFNLGQNGLYQIIKDPKATLRESVINDPVFSTRGLDAQREKYLKKKDVEQDAAANP
jgi:hypothetical protein